MNDTTARARTRFAPSPTGFLHIGGIRSALFSYLFAKKHGGDFILRLEDTDRERFVAEAEGHLLESLRWLGISPDEGVGAKDAGFGPYVQSKRLDIYAQHASRLLESGALYRCWCSPARLAELRQEAQLQKRAFKYDRHCLDHPQAADSPHVLRFHVPDNAKVSWIDAVRGEIIFDSNDIDDFVAIKSDGYPTYQFANVVDDHLMQISHVLRADEWVASTPKHLLLYQAFNWKPPVFAHLPAVVPPGGGKKLSKRHGAKSALELRDEGFVPDAVVNFLAMLGWNEGNGSTKEIYSRKELITAFSLERIQRSPAVFNEERLLWFNGEYIRNVLTEDEYIEHAKHFLTKTDLSNFDSGYVRNALLLERERIKAFSEIEDIVRFFFEEPTWDDAGVSLLTAKTPASELKEYIPAIIACLQKTEESIEAIEASLRALAEKLDVPTGKLFYATRVAITGRTTAPGLFETIYTLTLDRCIQRLQAAHRAVE